jgi:hypothetical protein
VARLVLVPSPFVGPMSCAATASALPDAVTADYGVVSGPDWYAGPARRIAAQADGRPWVAVMHSGAGGFAPAIAAAASDLAGLIFVDAVMPYPGRSCLATAPDALAAQLRALTTDGLLAPWTEWFGDDPTPRLIPDDAERAAFVADLPRTPFAFLEADAPPDVGWERVPAAYLQLSKGYEATAEAASRRGWPVRRLRLNHLAMASHPPEVAEQLLALAADLEAP